VELAVRITVANLWAKWVLWQARRSVVLVYRVDRVERESTAVEEVLDDDTVCGVDNIASLLRLVERVQLEDAGQANLLFQNALVASVPSGRGILLACQEVHAVNVSEVDLASESDGLASVFRDSLLIELVFDAYEFFKFA